MTDNNGWGAASRIGDEVTTQLMGTPDSDKLMTDSGLGTMFDDDRELGAREHIKVVCAHSMSASAEESKRDAVGYSDGDSGDGEDT